MSPEILSNLNKHVAQVIERSIQNQEDSRWNWLSRKSISLLSKDRKLPNNDFVAEILVNPPKKEKFRPASLFVHDKLTEAVEIMDMLYTRSSAYQKALQLNENEVKDLALIERSPELDTNSGDDQIIPEYAYFNNFLLLDVKNQTYALCSLSVRYPTSGIAESKNQIIIIGYCASDLSRNTNVKISNNDIPILSDEDYLTVLNALQSDSQVFK
jgi:hypothetical protein